MYLTSVVNGKQMPIMYHACSAHDCLYQFERSFSRGDVVNNVSINRTTVLFKIVDNFIFIENIRHLRKTDEISKCFIN